MACSYCSTATIEGKVLRKRSPELVVDSSAQTAYHLQMLGAALVHPERKEVIHLIPEIISRQDGTDKT